MKVATIIANLAPRYGGPPAAERAYAEALGALGVAVRLVTTNQDGDSRIEVPLGQPVQEGESYETWYYPAGLGSARPWSPRYAQGIHDAVRWADVVRVNSLYLPQNLYAFLSCRHHRRPYVVRPHGTLEPYQRQKSVGLKRGYDFMFGNRYMRSAAAVHFTDISESNHAGDLVRVDQGFVAPVPVHQAFNPVSPSQNRDILFLGRVTAKKRLDLLLDAWVAIQHDYPDSTLVVAGPVDPGQQVTIERARSLPGVIIHGSVDGEAKHRLFRRAAIFVLPSENENFGVAVAEAMAHGVPVIVTPQVALSERINATRSGIVAPGEVAHLSANLRLLLDSPQARDVMGGNGYRLVAEEFSHRTVGTILLERLQGIVDIG